MGVKNCIRWRRILPAGATIAKAVPSPDRPNKEWFQSLPTAEQERRRGLEDQLSRLAFSYAAGVLLAPPDAPMVPDASAMFSGSGFVLKLERGCFLCTAWHVVEHWLKRRADGERVLFQVGEVGLNARERLAWKDDGDDLAFLHLLPEELSRIGVQPYEPSVWPPPQPQVGQYVVIAGYPGVTRERESRRDVVFRSFTARLEVAGVRDRYVLCSLDRDYWEEIRNADDPPSGLDLGGMSGGPVMLVGTLSHPIVGVVSQVSEMPGFGLMRISTLAHVNDFPAPRYAS
jgi:hypothetical protein